jgi:hypothetical protein
VRNDDTAEAEVGALLVAEFFHRVRVVTTKK